MLFELVLAVALLLTSTQEAMIARAGFLQGCWEQRSGTRLVEEQWLKPRAGTMLGMSRTVRGDTLVEYEFVRIYQKADQLIYAAQPSGQAPAEFRSTTIEPNHIIFANPQHDFPQRIIYRAAGDSLIARIEGARHGESRGIDFRYARASCAP
ncbi:MAG TPA: DUF6265 family protein [Longimicrobiales bacterium]|nr:DUF6265 family protein [Longimicrobiales bacterium]